MPIQSGKYVNPGWANGTSPAMNDTEMNAISDTLEQVPILNGGTGATTVAGARNNLGLGNTNGAVPVANGGTGATTAVQARSNLGITPANIGALSTTGGTISGNLTINGTFSASSFASGLVLPVKNGGTGATTVAGARNALGLGNTAGALPVANGGTGASDAATARINLGISDYIIDQKLGITTGRSSRLASGTINYRKWNSGILEIWGYSRQGGNFKYSASSWFGGWEMRIDGSGSHDGEQYFTVWGEYPVHFIENPAFSFEYVGNDSNQPYNDMIFIFGPEDYASGSYRDYKIYTPLYKSLRGGQQNVVIGHPQFTFMAIGRWK